MKTETDVLAEKITGLLTRRPAHLSRQPYQWDAAVLLPLVPTDQGLSVLFEVRSSQLHWQPGDICFPGGRFECRDQDFAVTAVREAGEELGWHSEQVQICGRLNYLVTNMGPIVHPFVGICREWQPLALNKDEVAEVFTVPLHFLKTYVPKTAVMETASRPPADFPFELVPSMSKDWRRRNGYRVYFYLYEGHVIWGMTARILHSFLRRLGKDLCK